MGYGIWVMGTFEEPARQGKQGKQGRHIRDFVSSDDPSEAPTAGPTPSMDHHRVIVVVLPFLMP